MNGPCDLRALGALDLDGAAALHGDAFAALGERAWSRQNLAELLAASGVAGWLIEADGRAWHTRITDLKRDHERDADAARHGWQTLRLLHEHITGDPKGTAQLIRDVRRERLLLLAS